MFLQDADILNSLLMYFCSHKRCITGAHLPDLQVQVHTRCVPKQVAVLGSALFFGGSYEEAMQHPSLGSATKVGSMALRTLDESSGAYPTPGTKLLHGRALASSMKRRGVASPRMSQRTVRSHRGTTGRPGGAARATPPPLMGKRTRPEKCVVVH
eukprot:CAMPEP_0114252682 /NCGR_PEP_ID=MMETSP0058-20121206/15970_1 /TAXON_ID=36894 /ORGANISM="Pyramimonas parkeae, CCMP726" /LENGTH=154 /DNA_ID=CAMNT_0001366639 /DNA_START=431 /DNA_END=896 /DNA_ORIENTATION=-